MAGHFGLESEARSEIEKYTRILNAKGFFPSGYYQLDHPAYPLLSYINQTIALWLSDNCEAIPSFIGLAYSEWLQAADNTLTANEARIIFDYLSHLSYYLKWFVVINADDFEKHIAPQLLLDGFNVAPTFNVDTQRIEQQW